MKINFNKVSDEESVFELLPEGLYDATISKVEPKESSSGNEMWAITFDVDGEDSKVFDYLVFTEKTLNRVKKYYSLIGFDFSAIGEDYEPEPEDLLDKSIKIAVTVEDYVKNGQTKQSNKIDLFRCEPVHQAPSKAAAGTKSGSKARPFG